MEQITTVDLDLAKSVFQVHGIGATGEVLVRRRLRRSDVLRFFSALIPRCGEFASPHLGSGQVAAAPYGA